MIKDIHPGFGPEISFEDAIQKLQAWSKAGTEHAFLFNGGNESVIRVLSKIVQVHENIIVCKGESSALFFRFEDAKFVFGPMALMEYPIKQGSAVEGLHIFLQTGNYLFISSQAELPDIETLSLGAP
ncbi:MAG: hypothetical protein COB20_15305 [SAR86 cluster bacterium]|uniref:Uncharacterized protein n=1 Tax=SAR86 cluster bacterium TaxID=2030880 RepID=A0A2A4WWW0_9GAMM|nr:MAG: hypothetical protein COB20_15305 [SAR86 cluster bacterium]